MKIHEYQAKTLFEEYDIPTFPAIVADTPEKAAAAAEKLTGTVVVKAQVLVGGRGKAGGIKLAHDPEEARTKAAEILAMEIKSIPVTRVLVARAAQIEQEFYVAITVDRTSKMIVCMISAEGGVDIEDLAASRPEAIHRLPIHPVAGPEDKALNDLLTGIFEDAKLVDQARQTILKLYKLFVEKDCSLVEINPYAVVSDGNLYALDAKVNFDDNALFKHPEIEALRNPEEYSSDEIKAREQGLSFVSMDGNIGCIVNGAGLAMATMDIIKLFGGDPANFLDVGGSSSPEKVLNALKIILGNPKVEAILINIFGGITRCDDIAEGITIARRQIDMKVPLVIRLIGTNDTKGREILEKEGLSAAENMTEAVKKVLE